MSLRKFKPTAALFVVVMLTGCQSVPPVQSTQAVSTSAAVEVREKLLMALNDFNFSGGLGVWTSEQSLPIRIKWQQAPEQFQLLLSGPLGLGDMRLVEDGENAVLTRGNDAVASGKSTDQVIQQGLGLIAPVPVEQLKQWVRGLPGAAESVKRDEQGKLASLQYRDATGTRWQARFKRYTLFNDVAVPELITASGGPYNVRLVLKNWQIGSNLKDANSKETNNRLPIPRR